MNILVLTKYAKIGASSRERFSIYFERLKNSGVQITWAPLISDHILKNKIEFGRIKIISLIRSYWKRIKILRSINHYDVIWLEYEAFPYVPFFLEKLSGLYKKPVVVNYDDAVFHNYDQHSFWLIRALMSDKIAKVMRSSHTVVAGNAYLENYAHKNESRRVVRLPTVVDTDIYSPIQSSFSEKYIVKIGWLGSPSTQHYLNTILPTIKKLLNEIDAELHVMGVNKQFNSIGMQATIHDWSEEAQLDFLNTIDIGIMPLIDSPFARGKCGYKLIQYMAYQKPVVATPLEINKEIVENGVNGFLANTDDEWFESLKILCLDKKLRI